MIIKDLDLSTLSRKEFIAFISLVINSFVIEYGDFTDSEEDFINSYVDFLNDSNGGNDRI